MSKADMGLAGALLFALGIFFYLKIWPQLKNPLQQIITIWKNFAKFLSSIPWFKVIIITLAIGGIMGIVYTYVRNFRRKRERIEEIQEHQKLRENDLKSEVRKELNDPFKDKHGFFDEPYVIRNKRNYTRSYLSTLPKNIVEELHPDITRYFNRSNEVLRTIQRIEQEREAKKQKELEAQKKEDQKFQAVVEELFQFKKARGSEDAIPVHKKYPSDVMSAARARYQYFQQYKEAREKAIVYYGVHDLDTQPEYLLGHERKAFADIREEIMAGTIHPKKLDFIGGKLKKNFYRAAGLRPDIKRRVLLQGFTFVNGVDLNGKPTAGFYIKKTMEKESDHHFIMKHLFGEINQQVKIEYTIEGKRADAAYPYKGMKIGIEVETGTNKETQLVEKVAWLNQHFDYWVFVCSRDNLSRYMKYVDNVKSFCLTPKKAKAKFHELIAAVKQR